MPLTSYKIARFKIPWEKNFFVTTVHFI